VKKLIFCLFGAFLIGQKFILAFKWSATVINCSTTVITFILSFFITQSFCVTLEWRYNLGIKVLLWNGGNFFVDNTELRFYLRMAVNYRGNLFDNIGWYIMLPCKSRLTKFWLNKKNIYKNKKQLKKGLSKLFIKEENEVFFLLLLISNFFSCNWLLFFSGNEIFYIDLWIFLQSIKSI
jgi:hypothetical protein